MVNGFDLFDKNRQKSGYFLLNNLQLVDNKIFN